MGGFENFVATIARGKAVSFWWTMGVNQGHEATRTAQAIINLALMTGNIGRPGTGANSITGQCKRWARVSLPTPPACWRPRFSRPGSPRENRATLGIPVERIPAAIRWPTTRSSRD